MRTDTVTRLAAALKTSLCGCSVGACALPAIDPALCRTLLHLLAEGQPVSVSTLAEAIDQPLTDVTHLIEHSPNVEVDEEGSIVGTGLTLRPTPHRVTLAGRALYTLCALDTLMYLPLLGSRAEVESTFATTGLPVRLTLTPDGVASVAPLAAVVSIVVPPDRTDVRQNFCNHVHFFSSAQAASPWLTEHPGAVVLPIAEAYELGQRMVRADTARRATP